MGCEEGLLQKLFRVKLDTGDVAISSYHAKRLLFCCWRCETEVLVGAQYLGFSDAATSGIVLAAGFGGAVGLILGGISGDVMARRWPNIARPLSNQARPGCVESVQRYL